ncbi:ATP-binding protein [Hymenobacter sp. DH14]|uniref:histidine kinase n=1 Tax=Hymenobacter cyanobacteriorum TaxID=2926463 RepID=A0A9X1VJU2_9BACT|nr:ATP-binding protein [Hymenobacter cyanobacteriorum]MCI1189958.1 ATP-binding protein [Hymenobacter cyanobacteriorum]
MRFFLLLAALGLLFGVATAAPLPADTAALRINRLPADGLQLIKGWRYHPGDDPAWARPDFDDSGWKPLALRRNGREMPRATQTGVYWLRLRFRLSDSLRPRTLALQFWRRGTADVYLNGRLLSDSTRRARVRGSRIAPGVLELPANGPAEQVLALRMAPWHPSPLLLGADRLTALQLRLLPMAQLVQIERGWADEVAVWRVMAAVFLLLALLHWVFYRYNPTQRANRYFALYALAYCVFLASVPYATSGSVEFPSWAWSVAIAVVSYGLLTLGGLWGMRALYTLFGFAPGRAYWGLVLSGGLLLLAQWLTLLSPWQLIPYLVFAVLVLAESLRLTGRALRVRRRGAPIIAAGFGGGLLFILLNLTLLLLGVPLDGIGSNLLFVPAILLPPLGISLFLAREFALGAELLLVKLREVEQLSAQTLAQEQEKQALLAAQNENLETQVAQRTGELQRSLTDLRATQAQLIQKEKMASLGELTAGIAHEIQNPLNFVNNFSEVSTELLEELEEEQAKPSRDAGLEAELVSDLRQNLGKISHHGRRAAAIVKGMLEHSRTSTGERSPTDLNQLCEEYLRLAYQGLRAKDKTFNATLETDFVPGLPLVEAVGADVGRVLLNLFGNAFYAVQKRQQTGEAGYKPTVTVSTKQVGDHVEIRVADNGTGIPDEAKAKIFQPFFTTKPTGEGTGLGLSLSYDIITKAHGGTLAVESQPGQGTEFVISLPN